ncbi:hypothetical protein OB955_15070 [Halobacteria archaeon AArc-m2/3/4]|uniref:Uncharacterized protein n=1 Tax=Natronoglomus mannanivorans TaxID=2979990 RepID=A0ABT2QGJ6_9EURY|nr:hypothetical protein [Halobacteria archaeon AArc-m2/3/4]
MFGYCTSLLTSTANLAGELAPSARFEWDELRTDRRWGRATVVRPSSPVLRIPDAVDDTIERIRESIGAAAELECPSLIVTMKAETLSSSAVLIGPRAV